MANGKGLALFSGIAVVGGLLLFGLSRDEEEPERLAYIPAAMLPRDALSVLGDFFPRPWLQKVDLEVAVPARTFVCCAPASTPTALTKVGSNPRPGQIVIHPQYFDTSTADGLALIGHELFHVLQRERVPDFSRQFARAAMETERQGLAPWENPYEREAYAFERRLRDELVRRGFPVGTLVAP